MKIVITGAAGFIGSHLSKMLLNQGHHVVGIDDFSQDRNNGICTKRAHDLEKNYKFKITKLSLNESRIEDLVEILKDSEIVFHLGAQAGVAESTINPHLYLNSNIIGFGNILQAIQITKPKLLIYASSSSVYGDQSLHRPFREEYADGSNLKNFYAVTKWTNELMARSMYTKLSTQTIGLRFFTVFGEWGRPDMVYSIFAKQLYENQNIQIFGDDGGIRSFTHVSDVVEILSRLGESAIADPHIVLNLGNPEFNSTRNLLDNLRIFIPSQSKTIVLPMRNFDARFTQSSNENLLKIIGNYTFKDFSTGVSEYADWFLQNYETVIK